MTIFASGINNPTGLAFDNDGNLYVANDQRSIAKFDPSGGMTEFSGGGLLDYPFGIAFDSNGVLYVANFHSEDILRIDSTGRQTIFVENCCSEFRPVGLAFDQSGNLYVTSQNGVLRKFAPSGNWTYFGSGSSGLAFDSSGNLYAADFGNQAIVKFDPAGQGTLFAYTSGYPNEIAFDTAGTLYVAETGNNTIEKFDSAGQGSFFASGLGAPYGIAIQPSAIPLPTPIPTPTPTPPPTVCNLIQEFEGIAWLVPGGWFMQNNSQPGPGNGWFQGNPAVFTSQSGPFSDSYIAANFNNGIGVSTLSNWLLTPPVNLQNGAQFSFWTRTVTTPQYADRLQVRMSTNGTSTNVGTTATSVGDFTTLLLDINPTYTTTGYPNVWTNLAVTISGLGGPITGRLAFRYFVENGGPLGTNSEYIGIDTMQYACGGPTPTPTPTPAPISISGAISYCSNPVPRPVYEVTLTLTGSASGSTIAQGTYSFTGLPSGGNYTVTPTKPALPPGSYGINTVDGIAVKLHFLNIALLSRCRLTAADVNGDGAINTVDVIAIQRFFLGLSTGIANVGKYQFNPASRTYPEVVTDQTGQDYDTLIFGDVASTFADQPD